VRARGDARGCHLLTRPAGVHIDEITHPDDPRLSDLAALLERTFADPNSVLGLDRLREFLSGHTREPSREFHVIVAQNRDTADVVGLSIFSYVPKSNCGFSEYLVVDHHLRGQGQGRALFDRRKTVLDAAAARRGHGACRGLFIEVDSPWRTPRALLDAESFDAMDRLRVFGHLGFRRIAIAYVQPPLAPGKAPVNTMDLLFAPWSSDARRDAISTDWIAATLGPIWSAWAPSVAEAYLAQLDEQLRGAPLAALVDPQDPT
jgi:GNAT superfamily N-acetyltransferase